MSYLTTSIRSYSSLVLMRFCVAVVLQVVLAVVVTRGAMWCFDTVTTYPWGATSMYVILLALVRLHNEIKRKTSTCAPGSLFDSSRFVSPWSASSQRARISSKVAPAFRHQTPCAHLDPPKHVANPVVPQSNTSTVAAAGSSTGNPTTPPGSPPQPILATEQPTPEPPADLTLLSMILAYDLEVLGPEVDYMDVDEPEPAHMWAETGQDVEMASIADVETECAETMEQL